MPRLKSVLSCVAFLSLLLAFSSDSKAATLPATQIIAANSGQCLVPQNNGMVNWTPVVQAACTGSSSEYWSVVPVGNAYQLTSQSSGLCLNVAGNSTQSGAQLILWTCQGASGASNDKWALNSSQSGGSDYYSLAAVSSGMCANVNNASLSAGASITQWPCSGGYALSDQFYLSPASVPSAATTKSPVGSAIVAANSGQCLQPANGSNAAGTAIVQGICIGAPTESWSLVAVGSYYHIVSQSSGLCANVSGNATNNGAAIIQSPCQNSGAYNDQWSLAPVISSAGTYYHLVARNSSLCANIYGATSDTGASVVQWSCQDASALNDQFFVGAAALVSTSLPSVWSAVIPLPVNAVAVANLPNGNLLLWSAYSQFNYETDQGSSPSQAYYATFNPVTKVSSQALANTAGADLFCPGTALLPNGNILVNGGSSSPRTTIYNISSGTWQSDANMVVPRGYESTTLLSNKSVLTFGGSWSGGISPKNGEVWTGGQGWYLLNNAPDDAAIGPDPRGPFRGDNHMWLFAQSKGMVFQAGPSAQMNWIGTSGSGSIQSAGTRGADPFSINGNAVMYDIGKILKVGGAPSYDQDSNTPTYATTSALTIDITGGPGKLPVVKQVSSMSYPRAFSNAVVLPSGDVIVVGGQSIPENFTDTGAVLVPELWNHTTQTFTPLSAMQTPRTYHSTALLLADGRVFVGGGGQCGDGCADNHLNAEILTPPYLLNSDGTPATRPVIASAPKQAALGSTMSVTTKGVVSSFALVRLSATTHTVNNDQRRIPLVATLKANTSSTYSLAIPADPGVVLPGYYMLFALNAKGTPSVSTAVQIQ